MTGEVCLLELIVKKFQFVRLELFGFSNLWVTSLIFKNFKIWVGTYPCAPAQCAGNLVYRAYQLNTHNEFLGGQQVIQFAHKLKLFSSKWLLWWNNSREKSVIERSVHVYSEVYIPIYRCISWSNINGQ